ATNLRWALSRRRRGSLIVSTPLSIFAGSSSCAEAGASLSSAGLEIGATDCSVAALTCLVRAFCRCGLAGPVDEAVGARRGAETVLQSDQEQEGTMSTDAIEILITNAIHTAFIKYPEGDGGPNMN